MGNCCQKRAYQKINYLAPEEKEIEIKDFDSPNDKSLEILETKFNFFNFVQLVEFVNLLDQFDIQTSTIITDEPMRTNFSSKDEFLRQTMSIEEFQSFIENKIFDLEGLFEIIGNKDNQKSISIFKEMCLEIYKALELKLKQHYNDDNATEFIKKRNILAIGVLFCACENIEKVKLLYNIFKKGNEKENENGNENKNEIKNEKENENENENENKNENENENENENKIEEFKKSAELNDYLLTQFLISSYCLISARKKISNADLKIEKLEKDDLINLVNVSELKDCENLVNKFNQTFFEKESYKWEEFRKKFEDIDNGFGWVLSSKGIRRKLEENNI